MWPIGSGRLNEGHARRRGEVGVAPGVERVAPHASMKATPEDVAKHQLCDKAALVRQASMKATPEDVAKLTTQTAWHPERDGGRLNEGHARRRGEARSSMTSTPIRPSASMKATPEDVAKMTIDAR